MAVPRLVGSTCPSEQVNSGEDYGAYLAMLCTPARCPGKGACADPMMFRPLLQAKGVTREGQQTTYSFAQAWRAQQAEIDVHAKSASTKADRARKIAVLRDTTAVKHCAVAVSDPGARGSAVEPANTQTSGDASQLTALVLLQLLVQTCGGHTSSRPVGLLRVWALFQQLLGVPQ